MLQHTSEPSALFTHLESSDLHTVQEFKVLIQDNLTSARDPSFLNALVDFFIRTSSSQALDILAGIREPLDKFLLDKLNECMKSPCTRLSSLTLLSHVVRRQPSWLYKIVQAPLFSSLVSCLKTDTNIPVIMCGILTITTLLPMIPSQVGPFLNDISEIFARLASWNIHKPGNVPDVYQLHLQAAVYALFHRLYGMYPWNFLEFLRLHYADKEKEFTIAVLPMLERVRMHPQLIVGEKQKETDLSRWRKMEVHDILMECARVSLDTTESTRDDRSSCSLSLSESGRGGYHLGTRSNVSSSCKTASPVTTSTVVSASDVQGQSSSRHQTPAGIMKKSDPYTSLVTSQAILSTMWSPSVDCGLTTPPSSHPPSPGGSMLDLSLTSSMQMGYGEPSSSLTTPRDSPHSAISEDPSHRLFSISEGNTPSKAGRSSGKSRGKIPAALPRHPQAILHRTTSAPSTPAHDSGAMWMPASPVRKYSADRTTFNFGVVRTVAQQQPVKSSGNLSQESSKSSHSSTKGSVGASMEDSLEEDGKDRHIKCPKVIPRESSEDQETSVSLKDLPGVIRDLSAGHTRSEDAINAEVSSIVSSPPQGFMSKVIEGLHQHKEAVNKAEIAEPSHYVLNSTPKYVVENMIGHMTRGTAEGADEQRGATEREPYESGGDVHETGNDIQALNSIRSVDYDSMNSKFDGGPTTDQGSQGLSGCPKAIQKVSQKLFGDKTGEGVIEQGEEALDIEGLDDSGHGENGEEPIDDQVPCRKDVDSANLFSSGTNQGFTPIRDYSLDSIESPYTVASLQSTASELAASTHHNFMSYAHLLPVVLPHYNLLPNTGMTTPASHGKRDVSSATLEDHVALPLHTMFSPTEILDRHIALSDDVHGKELSRLPLTSHKSVNWTHYGGSPPADEVNLLKGQLQLLHNQVLYERHKREVHAGRNRRLLGKTHKAKAFEELNSAMKDQLRLQEGEILRLSAEVKLLRQENVQLRDESGQKDKEIQSTLQKLESEKLHLRECNDELNKLLVTHKQEVDKITKDLQAANATLFDVEQELSSTKADIATNRHLKDEIARLNKEILLLGEVNIKYKEKIEETKRSSALIEEEEKRKESIMKELTDCHDAVKLKTVHLEAAKSRITDLDALVTQKDHAIAEQKRYLESVKSLSKGKIEAMEAKYNSLKKVNQRLEAHILKLTKRLSESRNQRSQGLTRRRSNPDGAQLDSSSVSSGFSRSGSNSPHKAFDRRSSDDSHHSLSSDMQQQFEASATSLRHTPVGDEGYRSSPSAIRASPGGSRTSPNSERVSPASLSEHQQTPKQTGSGVHVVESGVDSGNKPPSKDSTANGKVSKGKSPAITFSNTSPFQRVSHVSSAPSHLAGNVNDSRELPDGQQKRNDISGAATRGSHSCPEFDKMHPGPSKSVPNSSDQITSLSQIEEERSQNAPSADQLTVEEQTKARTAVVDDIGSGVGNESIASLLELDVSVEEHNISH